MQGEMKPGEYIRARVRFLPAAEGGRKAPYHAIAQHGQDQPVSRVPGEQIFHRTIFVEAPEVIQPGDSFEAVLWLMWFPKDTYEDYQPEQEFELFEGSHLIATARIIRRFRVE